MSETPRLLPGTPPAGAFSGSAGLTDLLSDILPAVHLSGVVLFRAGFHEPWSVATPASGQLARTLPFRTERIIQFHIGAAGDCWLEVKGHGCLWLTAGDTVLLPYGNRHTLGGKQDTVTVSIATLFPPAPWSDISDIRHGGSGARATDLRLPARRRTVVQPAPMQPADSDARAAARRTR